MAVKDRLALHHDHAIVAEAERGERAALATYSKAISGQLPLEARRVIEAQGAGIQATYDHLLALSLTVPGA
jgi:uncharacterized protein (TIGR02284 family)